MNPDSSDQARKGHNAAITAAMSPAQRGEVADGCASCDLLREEIVALEIEHRVDLDQARAEGYAEGVEYMREGEMG